MRALASKRFLVPSLLTSRNVNVPPNAAPTTAPKPRMPYSRFARRESKRLAATSQPCDTVMTLNKLTQTLRAYNTHFHSNWSSHHKANRHAVRNTVAAVTAWESVVLTASLV